MAKGSGGAGRSTGRSVRGNGASVAIAGTTLNRSALLAQAAAYRRIMRTSDYPMARTMAAYNLEGTRRAMRILRQQMGR